MPGVMTRNDFAAGHDAFDRPSALRCTGVVKLKLRSPTHARRCSTRFVRRHWRNLHYIPVYRQPLQRMGFDPRFFRRRALLRGAISLHLHRLNEELRHRVARSAMR